MTRGEGRGGGDPPGSPCPDAVPRAPQSSPAPRRPEDQAAPPTGWGPQPAKSGVGVGAALSGNRGSPVSSKPRCCASLGKSPNLSGQTGVSADAL